MADGLLCYVMKRSRGDLRQPSYKQTNLRTVNSKEGGCRRNYVMCASIGGFWNSSTFYEGGST